MSSRYAEHKLNPYVATVIAEFLEAVDPDEERWPMEDENDELFNDLRDVVDGRVSDWWLCKEKGEPLPL